jgi:hypothetical protein
MAGSPETSRGRCLQPLRRIGNNCHKRPQSKDLVKMLGSNCIQEGQPTSPVSTS